MKTQINGLVTILVCLAALVPLSLYAQQSPSRPESAAALAFRNAATPAPPGNPYLTFKLSRNFPHSAPEDCPECIWETIPVNFAVQMPVGKTPVHSPQWHGQHWDEYIAAILHYVKEGQDPNLADNVGWRTKVGGETRWYNVPWMAYDPTSGREYVHGTTNERTANLGDLINVDPHNEHLLQGESDACKRDYPWGFESWSVGYYNEYGGMALGRAIPSTGVPQMSEYLGSAIPAGLPFPAHTVVVKILTTSAPPSCVSYLQGAPEWHVDRHQYTRAKGYACGREVQTSHIVQVDIAVVDSRSPSRWVYGTFGYDGEVNGATFWDHLVPIGLQWGSDPWSFPAVPQPASLPLQQSVMNSDNNLPEHGGCNGRLAGPVDNPQSSCTSCHASAYAAPHSAIGMMDVNVPPSFGFPGMCMTYSLENASYFQNQTAPQHFPGGRFSDAFTMDTSLQLAVAFTQYGTFHTNHAPDACTDPNQIKPKNPAMHRLAQIKERP